MVKVASENCPLSKIVISALLLRADIIDKKRQELNTKLGNLCTPYPNVHIVKHDNITPDHLHDNKHLKRKQIGLLVTNLKDMVFNRMRGVQTRFGSNGHKSLHQIHRVSDLPLPLTNNVPSSVPRYDNRGLGGHPLYSSAVKLSQPRSTHSSLLSSLNV